MVMGLPAGATVDAEIAAATSYFEEIRKLADGDPVTVTGTLINFGTGFAISF